MEVASIATIEAYGKSMIVTFSQLLTLKDIWDIFTIPGKPHPFCSLSGGMARVTF